MFKIRVNEIESSDNFFSNSRANAFSNDLSIDILFEYNGELINLTKLEHKIVGDKNLSDLIDFQISKFKNLYGLEKEYLNKSNNKDILEVIKNSIEEKEFEDVIRECLEEHFTKFKDSPYNNFGENLDFHSFKGLIKTSINNEINKLEVEIKNKTIEKSDYISSLTKYDIDDISKSINDNLKNKNNYLKVLTKINKKFSEYNNNLLGLNAAKSIFKDELNKKDENIDNNFSNKLFNEFSILGIDEELQNLTKNMVKDLILADLLVNNYDRLINNLPYKDDELIEIVKQNINEITKILHTYIPHVNYNEMINIRNSLKENNRIEDKNMNKNAMGLYKMINNLLPNENIQNIKTETKLLNFIKGKLGSYSKEVIKDFEQTASELSNVSLADKSTIKSLNFAYKIESKKDYLEFILTNILYNNATKNNNFAILDELKGLNLNLLNNINNNLLNFYDYNYKEVCINKLIDKEKSFYLTNDFDGLNEFSVFKMGNNWKIEHISNKTNDSKYLPPEEIKKYFNKFDLSNLNVESNYISIIHTYEKSLNLLSTRFKAEIDTKKAEANKTNEISDFATKIVIETSLEKVFDSPMVDNNTKCWQDFFNLDENKYLKEKNNFKNFIELVPSKYKTEAEIAYNMINQTASKTKTINQNNSIER